MLTHTWSAEMQSTAGGYNVSHPIVCVLFCVYQFNVTTQFQADEQVGFIFASTAYKYL